MLLLTFSWSLSLLSLFDPERRSPHERGAVSYVAGRLLVRVDMAKDLKSLNQLAVDVGAKEIHSYELVHGLRVYQFDPQLNVLEIMKVFLDNDAVLYAEPDFIYSITDKAEVNDPQFSGLWGLENNGQSGGTADADINASLMWDYQTGDENIVIAIIDTGVDYNHQDLAANMWRNPQEIPGNNKDDDGNGYVDDVYGISAITGRGDPMDDNRHGTHVAGTIGAVGNNAKGVVGVAQKVKILGCKFLSASGSGSISDAIECMDYIAQLKSRGVNIKASNNSWGGGGSSQAMLDAIKEHHRLGMLFIAAAGNEANNNDNIGSYPANYKVDNVISVAAIDRNDELASFSNYGKKTVHIAAPGVSILSTLPNNSYGSLSGTSMASPHVAGLAAIIFSHFTDLDHIGVKNLILTGGENIPAALSTTISQRRIRGADENGLGSLTCNDQRMVNRIEPVSQSHRIKLGSVLNLKATHINCSSSSKPLTVYDGPLGNVTLLDDDGDGVVSLAWKPLEVGTYDLQFDTNNVVTVTVYEQEASLPYRYEDVAFEYLNIGGNRLGAGDDTVHRVIAPFNINFAGRSYRDLYVSSNGTISFTDQNAISYNNSALPTDQASTLVSVLWDDLTTLGVSGASDVYVDTVGTAPNRKFIVEWWRVRHYRSRGLVAFQAVFEEGSSDIKFNYYDQNFSHSAYNYGASATVGLQTSEREALLYSYNRPVISSGKSILFTQR